MNYIKLLWVAVAALGAAVVLGGTAAQARTMEEIRKDGRLVIATEGAYFPFNYMQSTRLTGFEVELGDAVVRKMGLRPDWKMTSFDTMLADVSQGRVDMVLASFAVTEDRARTVAFTSPHYCSGGVIVSKDRRIGTADSLRGKVVAVQSGSSYADNVKKLSQIKEVKTFNQDTDARWALINGRVDAWVSDFFTVKTALDSDPGAGLKMGRFLFIEKIAAAIGKGNPELGAAYDKALGQVMSDGTYKTISQKYFKSDIRCL